MTMGSFKKYLRSGYLACFVTSAYFARFARKIIRKTGFGKRCHRARRPQEPAARPPVAQPRSGGSWSTLLRDDRCGDEPPAPLQFKAPAGLEAVPATHIEAAPYQVHADGDFYQLEVVHEDVYTSTENIWQDNPSTESDDGDFDSSDLDDTDTDTSDDDLSDPDCESKQPGADPDPSYLRDFDDDWDDSESEDSTDSRDYNDLDDSDSEDSTDDEFDDLMPNKSQKGGLESYYFQDESKEDRTDSDEKEYLVKERKQEVGVRGQLPDLYHRGNSWFGDDLSSEDNSADDKDDNDDYKDDHYILHVPSPNLQPVAIYRPSHILPRTELEPIAVLDVTDFVDPLDGQTVLGRGAFGEVTLRYQLSTGHWVAYKSFLSNNDCNSIIFEGQVMQLLSNHPSFPRVYGVVVCDGHKALVSEFLGDELTACPLTLTEAVHGGRPLELTEDEWCTIALDIIEGVRYMHRCNLLHMDIKTDNILLVEGADRWDARIIDFGECRQAPVPLVLPLEAEELDTNTPLEGMVSSEVHWTTCSDMYGVGETLRLIGQHKNIPSLEEGGAEIKKTSQWCSGYIKLPKIEDFRAQLLSTGKSLPGIGY